MLDFITKYFNIIKSENIHIIYFIILSILQCATYIQQFIPKYNKPKSTYEGRQIYSCTRQPIYRNMLAQSIHL